MQSLMVKVGILDMRSLLFKMCIYYVLLLLVGGVLLSLFSFNQTEIHRSAQASQVEKIVDVKPIAGFPIVAELKAPPEETQQPAQQSRVREPINTVAALQPTRQVGSAGNTYAAGNCTWYAKSKRPDLPNNLGNANTWFSRARAQGIPTGYKPRVGAIGQRGMHVVYIERVNSNGTVFISEMNYKGLGIVSTRTVPADYFKYIY